jgi:class 3 adenylate cyclase/pimeloyl-ACP methyl ester carboxylesterase
MVVAPQAREQTSGVKIPDVHYARSGDVAIAYQLVGEGPVDLVYARGLAGDLVSMWEQPLLARHVQKLASFSRVIMLDKRGTGLSDSVRGVPTLETRMDDLRAVMEDVRSGQAVLFTGLEGTPLATLFAATYPEMTAGLILIDPSARGRRAPDYPWAPTDEEWRDWLAQVSEGWGKRDFFERLLKEQAPTKADDAAFLEWFVWHMRRSLSPGAALSFYRMMMESDVSDVLSAVRVPTLIFHKEGEPEVARYFAQRIPGADVREIPGLTSIYAWLEDRTHEVFIGMVERFISRLPEREEPERVLATVLFVDMVGSTEIAVSLGDRAWRQTLGRFHALVRLELARHRGHEIDAAGDGFLASFDGPARAIRCAVAICKAVRETAPVRAGLHTGECEVEGDKLAGIAVHIGARIATLARSEEVLVSQTVKDLVAGSGIQFEDRGLRRLKGVPDEWRLHAVVGTPA